MSLAGRFDKGDQHIVERLTKEFGSEIWRYTVLVLTRGDNELTGGEEEDRELLEGFTKMFEKTLKLAGVSDIPVKSILSTCDVDTDFKSALAKPEIVAIPIGKHLEKPPDWAPLLFKEVIKRCRVDAIPAMLVLQGITPRVVAVLVSTAGSAIDQIVEKLYHGVAIFGGRLDTVACVLERADSAAGNVVGKLVAKVACY